MLEESGSLWGAATCWSTAPPLRTPAKLADSTNSNLLDRRRLAFSAEAHAYGLPHPRGVLLVGPQTGKSLTAKAIAHSWGMPLLRRSGACLPDWWGPVKRAPAT